MCIRLRKIELGDDVQQVYNVKKGEGYTFKKLPDNNLFTNLFRLDKDQERIVVGSNRYNQTSMFMYSESVPTDSINGIYVKYLELFFQSQYKPMPDILKSSFSIDDEFCLLNGAMNGRGDCVLLGTSKDPAASERSLWMVLVVSPHMMGYRMPSKPKKVQYSDGSSRPIDMWDVLGTAGTVAGLFSLF